MEAMLEPAELTALAAICEAWEIPFERWDESPAIAPAWQVLAVRRLAHRIQVQEGLAQYRAREEAACRLGLEWQTIRSRIRRS